MRLRIAELLLAVFAVSSPISATTKDSGFESTVLPITELRFFGEGGQGGFGTGFCLDPDCRFIATNYHVAVNVRPHKIRGAKVVNRYLATGPEDDGATMNLQGTSGPMRYTLNRDLAILELRESIPKYHGATFSLDELEVGQSVEIYAFPLEGINPIRKLVRFDGSFKSETPQGLLAFDYRLSDDKEILPGASGGIVVDHKSQKIVGVLNSRSLDSRQIVMAVPVQSLVDFVSKVQPYLAKTIFPTSKAISPLAGDIYPKYIPPVYSNLQHRPEESADVKTIRERAQRLADGMQNFIAVQSFAWGSGEKNPSALAEYEVRVIDGKQSFRELPDGRKELADVPMPPLRRSIRPGDEWARLPEFVGSRLGLKIHQAEDVIVSGVNLKVFQYTADKEDDVCQWGSIWDFGLFEIKKVALTSCYGEVWADQDFNILRISEHYELTGAWRAYQGVVTYGWLSRKGEEPRLIPLTIATQADWHKMVYWCRGQFTDYKVFASQTKIGPSQISE